MYAFCSTFKCGPEVYYNTDINDIDVLLEIHKAVKDEQSKDMKAEQSKLTNKWQRK